MSESKNQDTIAKRVKDRSKVKDRPGRVGGNSPTQTQYTSQ